MKHQIRPKYEILVSLPDKAVIHCSVLQVLSNDQLTQFQEKKVQLNGLGAVYLISWTLQI